MTLRPRRTALAGIVAMTLLVAACGGGEDGGGGGGGGGDDGASPRPAQEQITIASADAATPFLLQAGRYKFAWDASACSGVNFVLTGETQGFTWEKKTLQKRFSSIVNELPDDTYTVAQIDPTCTEWSITLDRLSN